MGALVEVILPIFLVLGFGYVARWRRLIADEHIDGLMKFAQGFALPMLLFRAISGLDLSQHFDLRLLGAFYTGVTVCFIVGILGARHIFGRRWEDSVAIGFVCMFSNTLMLGLPITERAFGAGALAGNYMIISVHAPFCYGVGITVMELMRHRGGSPRELAGRVLKAMFRNALVIGIVLGLFASLTGLHVPKVLSEAMDLLIRAAVPAALFGLGGILYRYRPEGDFRVIAFACSVSLLLHPAVTFGMGRMLSLDHAQFRSAVVTAAMAPGVNAYIFANMYGVAKRVAASTVLIATILTIMTAWLWLTAIG